LTNPAHRKLCQLSAATNDGITPLALTLQSAKQDVILGEPVPLVFKVKNESNSGIELQGVVDVLSSPPACEVDIRRNSYSQRHTGEIEVARQIPRIQILANCLTGFPNVHS